MPVVGAALSILGALRDVKKASAEHVFVGGRAGSAHFVGLSKRKARVIERSGVSFQPRDLRRPLASGLGELGFGRTVIRKISNHADGGVTAIYDRHSYDREKRDALVRWDRHLRSILAGNQNAKVVPLHA